MSPDQVSMINSSLLSINEKLGELRSDVKHTSEQVTNLRSDIIDIYNENKEDRKNCEKHRAEMNKKIDEQSEKSEEKAVNQKQRIFENKHVRIGTFIGILGVCIGIAGFIF